MRSFNRRILAQSGLVLTTLALLAPMAQAHTGHGETVGFWHGVQHPISGWDHVLAMVAVGLWAAQIGKKAIWAVPLAFVSVMALGGALGVMGAQLPFVEQGILASVLVLGVLIAAAVRLPLVASVAIVGVFALFHGHAHGAEMPETASGLAYGAGFVMATAFLHACGIGLALLMQQSLRVQMVRFAGAAITLGGVILCFQ